MSTNSSLALQRVGSIAFKRGLHEQKNETKSDSVSQHSLKHTQVANSARILSTVGPPSPPGESPRFQPVIECIDPVVAAGALFSHAEAMAAGAKNVYLRFVAR